MGEWLNGVSGGGVDGGVDINTPLKHNEPKGPDVQIIQLERKENDPNNADPPPYNFTEPWWKKHKNTSADCCMECIWRVSCVPCLCATCIMSSIFTAPCYCFEGYYCEPYETTIYEDGKIIKQYQHTNQGIDQEENLRNGKVRKKVCTKRNYSEKQGVQCCWSPFIFFDKCISVSSLCCVGTIKLPVRRTQEELQSMNKCSTWWGDCWNSCYDCLHCVVCCPCNVCEACWNSKCVQSCVHCVQNIGYYAGRCVCGCKDFSYYCAEGVCVRCGCMNAPKIEEND